MYLKSFRYRHMIGKPEQRTLFRAFYKGGKITLKSIFKVVISVECTVFLHGKVY